MQEQLTKPFTIPTKISKRNKHAFKELRSLIHANNAPVAFVGAGVSAAAELTDWKALLTAMHVKLKSCVSVESCESLSHISEGFISNLERLGDYPWRAEEYKTVLKEDEFFKILRDNLSVTQASKHQIFRLLFSLNFKHYLTTNFDLCLEEAAKYYNVNLNVVDWSDPNAAQTFLRNVASISNEKCLVYLHGRLGDDKSIVFTNRDYVNRYIVSEETNKKLFALFLTQRVVFIGYSLSDIELTQLLRVANSNLGGPRHFAILPMEENENDVLMARFLNGKFGIEPIYYQKRKGDHSQLLVLLQMLGLGNEQTDFMVPLPPDAPPLKPDDPDIAYELSILASDVDLNNLDPHRGRFGGKSNDEKFEISAQVKETSTPGWYEVSVSIRSVKIMDSTFAGSVQLFLHPTFDPDEEQIIMQNGEAKFVTYAYGTFTMGAKIRDKDRNIVSTLEINLADPKVDAPKGFIEH